MVKGGGICSCNTVSERHTDKTCHIHINGALGVDMKNVEFFSSTNLSVPDEGYERYRLMDALPVLSDPLQVETL